MSRRRRHFGRDGKHRHFVDTKFVVVDIAGNPIASFDTIDEACDAVENEYHGRRIVEMSFTNRQGDLRSIL